MALLQETSKFQKELKRKEKDIKRLLRRKRKLEEQIFKLAKLKLEEKKEKLCQEKQKIKEDIETIEKKEEEIKVQKRKIEAQEEKETDLKKKREIEKERWRVESKERELEKLKWKLEDRLSKIEKEIKKISKKLEKEASLRDQLKKIEEEIKGKKAELKVLKEKIQEIKKLEEEFKRAWKEFLAGDIPSALKKLERIQKELSEKIKEVKEEKKKPSGFLGIKINKRKKEFFEPLEYYQRGDISGAAETLEKLLKKIKEKTSSEEKEGKLVEEKASPEKELVDKQKKKNKELHKVTSPEPTEKPSVVIIKEKERPEDILEEFKKKLEEEKEKFIEEERKKLKQLREELERQQKEALKKMLEGRISKLEEEKIKELQKELLKKEIELEKRYQEKLKQEKQQLLQQQEELSKAEKLLSLDTLTPLERKQREIIIQSLRRKIEEERQKIENKENLEEQEKKLAQIRKLAVLEDAFEQALTFYNEKEFEKAKQVFSIIKEQLEEGKKLGLFVNLNNIPIYTKAVYFLEKTNQELQKLRQTQTPTPSPPPTVKISKRKIKQRKKFRVSFFFFLHKGIRSFLQLLFPLPIVGLDISDYSIELLQLTKDRRVLVFARTLLQPGVLVDGMVKKSKPFSQTLASLLRLAKFPPFRPKKGPVTKAVVSLPSSAVYIVVFRFDNSQHLFSQVKEEIEKTFPLPIEEIYWDYIECGRDSFGKIKVICVAAEKDVVDTLVYFLRANGIEPLALDVDMLSIARALSLLSLFNIKVGVLDIGAYITTFNILDKKGFVDFSISMPYAGYHFQTMIANSLNVPMEKAEQLMTEYGFQKSPVKEVLMKEVEQIVNEIKNALGYYKDTFHDNIQKIVLTGGCASLPGIVAIFKKYFPEMIIEIANPFVKLKIQNPLLIKDASLFINALGLALRAVSKNPVKNGINLLPEEIKKKERETHSAFIRRRVLILQILTGLLLLLIGSILYLIFWK